MPSTYSARLSGFKRRGRRLPVRVELEYFGSSRRCSVDTAGGSSPDFPFLGAQATGMAAALDLRVAGVPITAFRPPNKGANSL